MVPGVTRVVGGQAEIGSQVRCRFPVHSQTVVLPFVTGQAQWGGLGPESHIFLLAGPLALMTQSQSPLVICAPLP